MRDIIQKAEFTFLLTLAVGGFVAMIYGVFSG